MQFTSRESKEIGIFLKKDIIKEMSQELNIPEKEIKEIVDKNIAYIKKSVIEKPVLLISLPNLAKLRFNLKLGMSSTHKSKYSTSISGKKKHEAVVEKIELLKSYKIPKLVSFNKPLFERFYKKITKFKKAYQVYDKMYHMWAVIERHSNEILNKIR